MPKIIIEKNGKKCAMNIVETKNGVKFKIQGKDCKKVMGKDYFNSMEMKE